MDIKVLFNNLKVYNKKYKIDKKDIKIKKVKSTNIESGPFISNKIYDYIKDNLKYEHFCYFDYKNIRINLKLYYKKRNNDILVLVNKIITRIIFMMNITNTYKDVYLEIYDTPFKKELPCFNEDVCGKKLNCENVNTGYSWSNNIVIYRSEELLKLIIHEIIHLLDIDIKYEEANLFKKFADMFCVSKINLLINESYVETWAIILDIYLKLWEMNELNYDKFDYYLKKTRLFNLGQCAKICIYYNIYKYEDLFKEKRKCLKNLNDTSNVFSYHILKLVNLYNLDEFILNNSVNKKQIITKKYNYKKYLKYLLVGFPKIKEGLNVKIKKKKNKKYGLSLKMSLI
tara:strand:+ start:538 stop:1566 length:1029 start_codon:yes stop_codon:yes gene_type:complete